MAEDLTGIARTAEDGGIHTVWLNDHLLQKDPGARPGDRDMVEAYTTLGFLAAATQSVQLGAMVSPVSYRAPALLLKAVTTLDVLSGGRAWLGVGAGYPGEAEQMGLPMPLTAECFEMLAETLALAAQLARGDESLFEGQHYRLTAPANHPAPVRPDGIPILVGGVGEQKTLRLVAQYASACNLFDIPDGGATITRKLDVLRRHCEELGRDDGSLEKTVSTRLEAAETAGHFATRCEQLRALGIEHAVVITPGAWTDEVVAVLADAASRVRDL